MEIFRMNESKHLGTPLENHMKLSIIQASRFEEGRMEMKIIPCMLIE